MSEINEKSLENVTGGSSYWSLNDICEHFEAIDPDAFNNKCKHCRFFKPIEAIAPKLNGICTYYYPGAANL